LESAREPSGGPDKYLQNAIDALTKLDSAAAPPEHQLLLARCYRELAVGSLPIDAYLALEAAARADRILQFLVAAYPDDPAYAREWQRIHGFLTLNLPWLAEREYERIYDALERARRVASGAAEANRAALDPLTTRAHIQHLQGIIQGRLGDSDAAEKNLREAITLQSQLVQRQSEDGVVSFWLAKFQFTLAEQLLERGRPQEARELLERSAAQLEQRLQTDAKLVFIHGNLHRVYLALADALSATGAYQAAIDADRRAAEHRQYLPPVLPPVREDRPAGPPRRPPLQKPGPRKIGGLWFDGRDFKTSDKLRVMIVDRHQTVIG
jgi:tetratricopeptide (TPR) repeat protein